MKKILITAVLSLFSVFSVAAFEDHPLISPQDVKTWLDEPSIVFDQTTFSITAEADNGPKFEQEVSVSETISNYVVSAVLIDITYFYRPLLYECRAVYLGDNNQPDDDHHSILFPELNFVANPAKIPIRRKKVVCFS